VSTAETNKALARRYWQELWNEKRREALDELTREPVKLHFPVGQAHRPPSLTAWFETALRAFPDVHFDVLDMIAEGDMVVTRWRYHATNTGPFLGRPPTGRAVTDEGITTLRFEDGKVVEEWVVQDSLGLLKQLGILDP
jgi:steroid delta-isomerase-like uncharacterized protein